uniref:Uncharacterized protein n=1 Tax=Magallana gigas TaxID=29159 RepID=A0A8W8MIF1_MAGGI
MRRYHSQNVNIGDVVQQWNDMKWELKIVSDRTFADFLIQVYKRTITPTTSGEVVFASPTHTGPSTSTPIRLTSKGRSALNISLSTVTTSTATEERKARRLPRREREKTIDYTMHLERVPVRDKNGNKVYVM